MCNSTIKAKGIDISMYNDVKNWKAVAKQISFVYVKASQGRPEREMNLNCFIDRSAEKHIKGASSVGLAVGCYHYLTAHNNEEAVKEADFFADFLDAHKSQLNLMPVVDVESRHLPTTKEGLQSVYNAFIFQMVKRHYTTMLYTNPDFLTNRFKSKPAQALWLALWRPLPPQKTKYPNIKYWQCGTANLNGINGPVDFDYAM